MGWLVLLLGIIEIVRAVSPGLFTRTVVGHFHSHRLVHFPQYFLPIPENTVLTKTALIVVGLLLLMLSHGLRRRKRRAWQAMMTLLFVIAFIHVEDHRFLLLISPAVLLAAGWLVRHEFYAVGDPRSRWGGLQILAALVAADMVIGVAYLYLDGPHGYGLVPRLQTTLYGLIDLTGPVRFSGFGPQDGRGDLFGTIMVTLGIFTLVVCAYLFLRPAKPIARLGAQDATAIRGLLDKHGEADSLGYFTLRNDKSVIWSPTGKSCIGYRVQSGVMLASGDPLGDTEAWPGAINAFLDEAARHAWVPAVIGCSEHGAEVWCRTGDLTALELGDEAVVEVSGFSLQGRPMRNVRQMVTRVGRAGYVAEVRRVGDVPPAELARMVRQADTWRGDPTERGFSMALGRIGGPGDDRCVIATAMCNGELRALLHFVPWGCDGLSLDLMRRDRSAQPGLNDFMIVEAIKAAQNMGVKRISLNFAVFRAALERGERIGAGPILRAWRRILLFLSRWFQIESLYKFNSKFNPDWLPRFLVFPSTRDTPRIGLAALEAEAFLVWPSFKPGRIAANLRVALRPRRRRRPVPDAPGCADAESSQAAE